MLAIIRIILVSMFSISICIFGIIYCLLKPRQPYYTAFFSRLFGSMAPIFGIRIEIRNASFDTLPKHCIYVANHQNNYDMITVACVVQPRTIIVGKKSLLWIPLFGQLYWLCGNIFINRRNGVKAYSSLIQMAKTIKLNNISIWIFPEGTRSFGKGLLPFKTGAFQAAISAGVPVVPICVSNISNNKIKLNRWFNGLVIIEIMSPIETQQYKPNRVRSMTKYCYDIMTVQIDKLNKEVIEREMQITQFFKTHYTK